MAAVGAWVVRWERGRVDVVATASDYGFVAVVVPVAASKNENNNFNIQSSFFSSCHLQ